VSLTQRGGKRGETKLEGSKKDTRHTEMKRTRTPRLYLPRIPSLKTRGSSPGGSQEQKDPPGGKVKTKSAQSRMELASVQRSGRRSTSSNSGSLALKRIAGGFVDSCLRDGESQKKARKILNLFGENSFISPSRQHFEKGEKKGRGSFMEGYRNGFRRESLPAFKVSQ